jgi:oligo-1,6-glucosidase/glucan 1,6-alpha-glucosidase
MKKKWWHKSCVYQVYPRSFYDSNNDGIGDIPGIIAKLDYIQKLGVEIIWISPFYKSPMVDHGYDIADYRNVAEEYGTIEDFKNLIEETKKRNIHVVIDLVLNHTSDEHEWFQESKKSKNNLYRDYYIWRDKPNSLQSTFSGSAWDYDEATEQYFLHLFSKEQPDLNWKNEEVRFELYKMINYWISLGVKGFRIDVLDLLGKDIDNLITANGPKLHDYVHEMNVNTFGEHDLMTVGETWDANIEEAVKYSDEKNDELSMIFQFGHITAFWGDKFGKWDPKPFDLVKLKKLFKSWQASFENRGWNSLFWNNHDLPRAVSKYGSEKFRVRSAKMLATTLHFMKGTPYIFQGEELGMTNNKFSSIDDFKDVETINAYHDLLKNGFKEEDIIKSIHINGRDNARTPMHWNAKENAGFTKGTPWLKLNPNFPEINADSQLDDANSVFNYYRQLIELRKNSDISDLITYGKFEMIAEEDKNIFAYYRFDEKDRILVINNFSDQKLKTDLVNDMTVIKEVIISNGSVSINNFNDLILEPYQSVVLKVL